MKIDIVIEYRNINTGEVETIKLNATGFLLFGSVRFKQMDKNSLELEKTKLINKELRRIIK